MSLFLTIATNFWVKYFIFRLLLLLLLCMIVRILLYVATRKLDRNVDDYRILV